MPTLPYRYSDAAAVAVVLDGIIAEVIDHLMQHLPHPTNRLLITRKVQGDLLLVCHRHQALQHFVAKCVKVNAFPLHFAALLHPGEIHNVLHQIGQTDALFLNVPAKLPHLVLRHKALAHKLGEAGDGGQRRFQLMGYIGGELPAQLFPLFPLCHIHGQHHGSRDLPGLQNRACYDR